MGLTREKLKERAIAKLDSYIKEHGSKIGNYIVWDTYPICVKDICLFSAVIDLTNYTTFFCDFEKESMTFNKKYIRTYDDLDYNMINSLLSDLIEYDNMITKKNSKPKKSNK